MILEIIADIRCGTAAAIVDALIERSAWFSFTPLPDDQARVNFKGGEGHEDAVAECLPNYSPEWTRRPWLAETMRAKA